MIRNRAATEARLLAAAKEHLELHGFMHFGINTVAARAGADKVLIYRYFGGQQGLLKSLGQEPLFPHDGLIRLYFQGELGDGSHTREERLGHALDFYTKWVEEHPLTRMLFASENAVPPNPLIEAFRQQRDVFEALLADMLQSEGATGLGAESIGETFYGKYGRKLAKEALFTEAAPVPRVSQPRLKTESKAKPLPESQLVAASEQSLIDEGGLPENLL